MQKKWTGERLETFIYTRDTIEHLHRYAIVNDYIKGKTVLDIASGEGYGSNLISKNALSVIGVDIDESTIKMASLKYQKNNLEFKVGRVDSIPVNDHSIDVVVSFETLEHHDKHQEMFLEIKRVLTSDGILIMSTPDKSYYSDKRNFKNVYHIKELYKNEFQDLISNNFKKSQILNQKYANGNSLIQEDNDNQLNSVFSGNYDIISEHDLDPLYLISISSDVEISRQKSSIFNGKQILEQEMTIMFQKSNSFRLGSFILSPFKFLKKILK
jgi:ubiquinone/menaquinone biosynthesis C-methylase UbiE